jgi:hypothetical protein
MKPPRLLGWMMVGAGLGALLGVLIANTGFRVSYEAGVKELTVREWWIPIARESTRHLGDWSSVSDRITALEDLWKPRLALGGGVLGALCGLVLGASLCLRSAISELQNRVALLEANRSLPALPNSQGPQKV